MTTGDPLRSKKLNNGELKIMKKSILFVCDVPNWAFHIMANSVIKEFSEEYEFYIDFISYYEYSRKSFLDTKGMLRKLKFLNTKYKVYKKYGNPLPYRKVDESLVYDVMILFEAAMEKNVPSSIKYKKLIKGIFTDSYPPLCYPIRKEIPIEKFIRQYIANADALICGCQNSVNRYKPFFEKTFYINEIRDENLFRRRENVIRKNGQFVIGWTGNPKRLNKGFYSHIIPAIKIAKSKRKGIVFKTQFSGSFDSLADFHQNEDLIVIASIEDTGPSLFSEASLCGVPAISTSIGWPMEVIENNVNGIIVERKVEAIADAIIRLYDDRDLLESMKKRIRDDYIKILGRNIMKERWLTLFKQIL